MREPYDTARAAVLRVLDEWEVRPYDPQEAADAALDAVPPGWVRTENGWGRIEQVEWWHPEDLSPVYRIVEVPDATD